MNLRKRGIKIVRYLDEGVDSSLIRNTPSSKNVTNVPKKSYKDIDRVIKSDSSHELYGSLAQSTHTYSSRTPNDVDVVVSNPRRISIKIKSELVKDGAKSRVIASKSKNAYIVQVVKNGKWVDVIDVHPKKGFHKKYEVYGKSLNPEKVQGFNVQPAKDQLLRKANSVLSKEGPSIHRRIKDQSDFITSSRLLLDTRQLRLEAHISRGHSVKRNKKELSNIKKKRGELNLFISQTKRSKGYSQRKFPLNKDPIPERKEKQFISFARKNHSSNINNMFFSDGKIKVKRTKSKNKSSKKFNIGKFLFGNL